MAHSYWILNIEFSIWLFFQYHNFRYRCVFINSSSPVPAIRVPLITCIRARRLLSTTLDHSRPLSTVLDQSSREEVWGRENPWFIFTQDVVEGVVHILGKAHRLAILCQTLKYENSHSGKRRRFEINWDSVGSVWFPSFHAWNFAIFGRKSRRVCRTYVGTYVCTCKHGLFRDVWVVDNENRYIASRFYESTRNDGSRWRRGFIQVSSSLAHNSVSMLITRLRLC